MGHATILQEMRTVLAAMATSRDPASFFLQHLTNDPFEKSPLAGADGFYVMSAGPLEQTEAFGRTGTKEVKWRVHVMLGHAPFETDDLREEHVIRDIDRICDVLECRAWTATEVGGVWPAGGQINIDRNEPSWWVSTIPFDIIFTEAIATS